MPPNYQHNLRQQLRNLKQTGSVQEYGIRFRNTIGQIAEMAELDKVTYFIEGLKPATKMEVVYQAPEDFERIWQLAKRFDTAMFSSNRDTPIQTPYRFRNPKINPSSSRNNGNGQGPVPMEIDHIGASNSHNNYSNRNNNNRRRGTFNGKCYNCGTPGHMSKDCRVKRRTNLNNVENTASNSNSTPPPATNNSLKLTHVEENKERLLRFTGKINGHSAFILLDSGAS